MKYLLIVMFFISVWIEVSGIYMILSGRYEVGAIWFICGIFSLMYNIKSRRRLRKM